MNNVFSWDRFCKVVHKDFSNIWQHVGSTLLIITLLPIAAWLLWLAINSMTPVGNIPAEVRWGFIIGCACFVSIMVPSRMYRTCNVNKEGIYFAMLPASKLEKYLSMVLFSVIVCPLLSLCGGIVLDLLLTLLPFGPYKDWIWQPTMLDLVRESYDIAAATNSEEFLVYSKWLKPARIVALCIVAYLGSCATFLFTNTIFKKHKVLMTFLWIWLIEFAIQLIATPVFGFLAINDDWMSSLLDSVDPARTANVTYWVSLAYQIVFAAVFFWWTSHRLKKMKY